MTHAADPLLERLVAEHRRFLAFLVPRIGSEAEAEDLLQDAYVKTLHKGGELKEDERATAWFYQLLRNAMIDRARTRAAEAKAMEAHARELTEAEEMALETQVCQCVQGLLATLPSEQSELLRRVDLEGHRPVDMAEQLGLSANALSVRLHRARKALHARLSEACGTCATHGCLDCSCGKPVRVSPSVRLPK
jgi:RNA polymerase sigma factor (sigma-70 family)